MALRKLLLFCLCCWFGSREVRGQAVVNQATLDELADTLKVTWTVVTNTRQIERFDATLTLENTGTLPLQYAEWSLYLYSVYPLEPDALGGPGKSIELQNQGVMLTHVNGMLFKLSPTPRFRTLPPGGSRVLRFNVRFWSVSQSDVFPNWYLTGSAGTDPRIIANTAGVDANFVTPPLDPQQQKRYSHDLYPARTAQQRYVRNYVPYSAGAREKLSVVPTPWSMTSEEGQNVNVSGWAVVDDSEGQVLDNEVSFLVEQLAPYSVHNSTPQVPLSNAIVLNTGQVAIPDPDVLTDSGDAYSIVVDDVNNVINITGRASSGVFYGLQTLLSLLRPDATLPKVRVFDAPRFRFRSLYLDIARNFRSREEIERLLRLMAMYKLNKFHLHLSDDEGWRIEIPGLPELTEVGARRCHDPEENECLLPQLGSGPFSNNSGSGYLKGDDYRSILRTANRLHIEVIPEIDLPGHARAAIKAMEKRYRVVSQHTGKPFALHIDRAPRERVIPVQCLKAYVKFLDTGEVLKDYMAQNNTVEAEKYRLVDVTDDTKYLSPQAFNDNVINVCRNSTYAFVTKVVEEIKRYHQNIQPLHEYHSGFDEVGGGNAWLNSTICQQLTEVNSFANQSLKQYFFKMVADITHDQGLALGGWEDGLMLKGNQPFNRSLAPNPEVFANIWDNVWEWGTSSRTYTMANEGYKVVMSHATSLYFDHPYEPDWQERGYYWATRFTDSQKTFSFMPMDYYANIKERTSGQPITRQEVCGENDVNCPPLEKPENIVGMQGHLWSETARTIDQADSMLFPRVLALAERAWHYAPWEKEDNATLRQQALMEDWYAFARAVGYRELPRLDRLGVKYRVPPPGAEVERQRLMVAPGYPGLQVEYSRDFGRTWHEVTGTERVLDSDRLWLRTRSADGQRYSRTVELQPVPKLPAASQTLLDYMGQHLEVSFEVKDNYETYGMSYYVAAITLNNTGNQPIPAANWEIHFPSVQWVEDDPLKEGGEFILQEDKMALSHVQGYQFRLYPLPGFAPLEGGTAREIVFKCIEDSGDRLDSGQARFDLRMHCSSPPDNNWNGEASVGNYSGPWSKPTDVAWCVWLANASILLVDAWSVSRYEQFPNYFVVANGANAQIITNTAGESLSFVKPFSKVNQWKRDSTDKFDPFTPSARYGKQADVKDYGYAAYPFLPSPLSSDVDRTQSVSLKTGWVVVAPRNWSAVAQFFVDQLTEAQMTVQEDVPDSKYILLRQDSQDVPESAFPGAYSLTVSPEQQNVVIVAPNATGALYGLQSLLNMALQSPDKATVIKVTAKDAPRFGFRGMYIDVSRNFHDKESVLKLVDVMGLYKLNRLHIHLGDDEGWRLEIPGLPELTTVGSTRCYDPTEERCLVPVMGSGPFPDNAGSGFYTAQDYKDILKHAADRHIQVIPEFDMPGHARAAIKAMALRRKQKLEAGDIQGAHEYELDEYGDQSLYSSVQLYDDNAINPCMESSYRFIGHVMQEMKKLHAGINPLHTYHFGGDEVAEGAWLKSKACSDYVKQGTDLKFLFSTRVAKIAGDLGLNVGAWEDGIIDHGAPIPREDMKAKEVFANAWQNIWEWGSAKRAYNLANAGYRVVMSQATHLYFDHPYEPSPDERGFYWATRYTDSRKTFFFQPQHLWSNVGITRFGDPISLQEVCGEDDKGCPQLRETENVVGMQGHLWSETVRTTSQLEYMIFPRLLALAERAWHRGKWEGQEGGASSWAGLEDWIRFANTVGYGQLLVLDRLNVSYRVPPPGVKQDRADLLVNTEFPGLRTQFRISDSEDWQEVKDKRISAKAGQLVHVRTLSADGKRHGQEVTVEVSKSEVSSKATVTAMSSALGMITAVLVSLVISSH